MQLLQLFAFIEKQCKKYNIDKSHGSKHAKGCLDWAKRLIEDETDISADETKVALYSAALHDMCDKKYTNPEESSIQIRSWLLGQSWSHEMAEAVIKIINSMSYSSLKQASFCGIPIYPDLGKWQKSYHLARHADLLDAYLVGRCFLYTQRLYPDISDEACWKIVENLFDARVFRYVQDGWIFLPKAIEIAKGLEKEARRSFVEKHFEY